MRHQTTNRILSSLAVAAMLLGACAAPATQAPAPAAEAPAPEARQMEIFSWWTNGGEADGLNAMFEIFSEKNPGVDIVNATVAGGAGTNAKTVLKTRLQGGQPPDTWQVHAGKELTQYVDAGQMEPLTAFFKEQGFDKNMPQLLLDQITYKGEIYSVPVNIHRSNVLWFNMKVLADNGIAAPATMDEFFAAASKLKAAGIIPLAVGGADKFEAPHLFESVLLSTYGQDDYVKLMGGDAALWGDARLDKSIGTLAKMLSYSNEDRASIGWSTAADMVLEGKAAMTIMGDWAHGYMLSKGAKVGTDYGYAAAPGNAGVFMWLSDSFGLAKGAPHPEEAKAWLAVAGSREGQDAFNPKKGSIPARTDADVSLYDEYLKYSITSFGTDKLAPSIVHGAAAPEPFMALYGNALNVFSSDLDGEVLKNSLVEATSELGATGVTAAAYKAPGLAVMAPDCNYGGNMKSMEAVDDLTVKFTMCAPDPAFLSKMSLMAFPVLDYDYLKETGGDAAKINDNPVGTGPYMVEEWVRGDHISFVPNPNYWGTKPTNSKFILKWGKEAAARLLDLQSGNVDGIAGVATDDYKTVAADKNLTLYPRKFNNFLYLGFNNNMKPFDNEVVRQAFAMAIDKERIVKNFYPAGAVAATQFVPAGVTPGYSASYAGPGYDPKKAKQMLVDAGFDFKQEVLLSYAERTRPYFPQPSKIAQDVQAQLKAIGINAKIGMEEWAAYLPAVRAGERAMYFLGWSEDYPDATNWYDVFLMGSSKGFGEPWKDIMDPIAQAAKLSDPVARQKLYDTVNALVDQHVPMTTIANGVTALAFNSKVGNVVIGPYNENYQEMTTATGQLVYSQDGEPVSLDCADETDGSSINACQQIFDTLYSFKFGTAILQPALAEKCTGNAEATEWTCTLRAGVKFSNDATLDSNDVVASYARMWDFNNELRKGNTGVYQYWLDFFGPKGLNQPAE